MGSKARSGLLKVGAAVLVLSALWSLTISVRELTLPPERHGEFDAMHNFFQELMLILICVFALLQLICTIYLLKLKKWAFILTMILLLFQIPLTDMVQTPDLIIQVSEGNAVALVKEIIPVMLMGLLISRFREFWPEKG